LWFVDDYLIGASMLDYPKRQLDKNTAWLKSDFVVDSNVWRLSKLLLMSLLSKEYHDEVNIRFKEKIELFVTNVFTDKPVSMKYRGAFKMLERTDGKLTYIGELGRYGKLDNVIIEYLKSKRQSEKSKK